MRFFDPGTHQQPPPRLVTVIMKAAALALLFASGSLAARGTAGRRARHLDMMARGGVSHHSSNPFIAADVSPAAKGEQQTTEYSSNWSGAAKTASGFTAVSGEITVPVPQPPPGGSDSKTYYASAWVGIDGFTCSSAILQTGIDVAVEGSSTGYDAWYEWLPNGESIWRQTKTIPGGGALRHRWCCRVAAPPWSARGPS